LVFSPQDRRPEAPLPGLAPSHRVNGRFFSDYLILDIEVRPTDIHKHHLLRDPPRFEDVGPRLYDPLPVIFVQTAREIML
jgi:hypothetical protein